MVLGEDYFYFGMPCRMFSVSILLFGQIPIRIQIYIYIYICTVYVYVSQNLSLTPTFFWVFHGNFLFQNLPKHNFSRIEWMIQKRAPQFQALEASWRCLVSMLLAQTPWRERSGPEPRFLVRQKFLVGPTNPAYLPGCLFG